MFSRIENLPPTLVAGISKKIKLVGPEITGLWMSFMPRLKEITNRSSSSIFSIQIYDPNIPIEKFDPITDLVIKWAAVPVTSSNNIPQGLQTHELRGGMYAVFIHRGLPADFPGTMNYIFQEWLPASGYLFDWREQFEVMGEKYKHNDPASEEEVWIPIRQA